jgi:hypothetical protein
LKNRLKYRKRLVQLGCVYKITKAHYRRLDLHIFVEKPRRRTTAPVFFGLNLQVESTKMRFAGFGNSP